MESEIRLPCERLYKAVVLNFNTFSSKYYFYRLFPSFIWPQIVNFRSIERLCENLVSFYFVLKNNFHKYFILWARQAKNTKKTYLALWENFFFLMLLCLWQNKGNTKNCFLCPLHLCILYKRKRFSFLWLKPWISIVADYKSSIHSSFHHSVPTGQHSAWLVVSFKPYWLTWRESY